MTSPELDGLVAELVERSTLVVLSRGRLVIPHTETYLWRLDGVLIGYIKSIERLSISLSGDIRGLAYGLVYLCEKKNRGSAFVREELVESTVTRLRRYMVLDDLSRV
jgi:hypothetical protein